jgi:hypothetical protein
VGLQVLPGLRGSVEVVVRPAIELNPVGAPVDDPVLVQVTPAERPARRSSGLPCRSSSAPRTGRRPGCGRSRAWGPPCTSSPLIDDGEPASGVALVVDREPVVGPEARHAAGAPRAPVEEDRAIGSRVAESRVREAPRRCPEGSRSSSPGAAGTAAAALAGARTTPQEGGSPRTAPTVSGQAERPCRELHRPRGRGRKGRRPTPTPNVNPTGHAPAAILLAPRARPRSFFCELPAWEP